VEQADRNRSGRIGRHGGVGGAEPPSNAELARHLVEKGGCSRGICCVLGVGGADWPLAVADASGFLVHALDSDQDAVRAMRDRAAKQGLTLERFLAERAACARLPHADNVVDVILAVNPTDADLAMWSPEEMLRVLRPNGVAIIGVSARAANSVSPARLKQWAKEQASLSARPRKDRFGTWITVTKPAPDGLDDWSHWEHGPDNNPASADTVIRAPYMNQWLGQPYYIAMPAVTTAAGGRTFVAMGHIAHHEREEPWLNTLLARNGYNGAELWRRRLPDGYLVHRSAFIATDDTFFMIDVDGEGCLLLDPETGREKGRIRIPEVRGQWKWMALVDDVLFVLAGDEADPNETTVVRSQGGHWSWFELSQGYYQPRIPWGFGRTLAAYDIKRSSLAWMHIEEADVDSRAMALGDGRVFYYAPESHLASLDARTGRVAWRNDDPKLRALIEEPGRGLESTPGFRTQCLCVYTPKGLFFQGQARMNVVGVSKDDGGLLWHRRKTTNNPNVLYLEGGGIEDGNILVGIGPGGNTLVLDPATGETLEDLGFKKRSCVRLTATHDSVFCRGWPEGWTRYDRHTKAITFDGALRPACNDGTLVANGLLYLGPWLCDCNLSLMGTVALTSAADIAPAPFADRLERAGDGWDQVAPLEVSDLDWPTYRGSNDHGAASAVEVSTDLHPHWVWRPDQPFMPTPPVTAGGRVFLAGADGSVRSIDAASASQAWVFRTAGPILQSPTVWEGRVFVGSGDGYVYALEAATGRLLWRFRAAPAERRIMVYGHLCSAWPVNSGVLIHDGVAHFAAGIVDYDGTHVYAVDAKSGALKWHNGDTGHLSKALRKGVSAQGNLTILGNALMMAGGNVISPAPYDLETGAYQGPKPHDGSPRANRGEEIGVLRDRYLILGGRLRYSARGDIVNPGNFVVIGDGTAVGFSQGRTTPAWDDNQIVFVPRRGAAPACYAVPDKLEKDVVPPSLWNAAGMADVKTAALALADNAAVVVFSSPQPYNSLHIRWRLALLQRTDGATIASVELPRPPSPEGYEHTPFVFSIPQAALPDGVAIGRDGRIFVVMADGAMVCYGAKG